MLFSTQAFIVLFMPCIVALYYAVAGCPSCRKALIVVSSLLFYGFWDWRFLPLLIVLTLANWQIAHLYVRTGLRLWLLFGVGLNLGVLVVFKYANFLASTLVTAAGGHFTPWSIILPLGISFFVFQKISYLVDLHRGDRHAYGLLDFMAFVTFFPQLIAGPIVRHNEIIRQFDADPRRDGVWENLGRGFVLFVIGLAKKVGIADGAGAICDPLFQAAETGPPLDLGQGWTAAVGYALQIYFDFSGYSDMAIGLALMFGLRLPFNFDAPYRARSIRDFWRRWHMTLSRFLRDYLYIPLGGNRAGGWRQARNVVITMLLAGLWHGAGWTYVAWGGLHGAALAVNGAWSRRDRALPPVLGWAVTMVFVMGCWVLFRAPDLATAAGIWRSMIGLNGLAAPSAANGPLLGVGVVVALFGHSSQGFVFRRLAPSPWMALATGAALTMALLEIGGQIPNAFIYFQF